MKHISCKGWISWFLGAAFFYAMYVARLTPGVMTKELMMDFQVTPSSLGYLSMLFFYPYMLLQIPAGIFVDRFGPKIILIIAVCICGVACFLFSQSPNYQLAMTYRFFFGVGAALAFVTSLKLAAIWFPASRIGLIAGLTQTMGMLGAATGEQPVAALVQHIGWRQTLLVEVGLFVVLLVLIIFFVSEGGDEAAAKTEPNRTRGDALRQGMKNVLMNPQSWLVGLYTGFIFAPTVAFAELWGNSYLRVAYDLTSERAAFSVGLIFMGWAVGGPLFGWLSDSTGRRKPWMLIAAIVSAVTLLTVIYVEGLPYWAICLLLFGYGVFNTGVVVAYAVASEINPKFVAGVSLGIANMLTIIVGALSQPLVGEMLERAGKQFDPLNYAVTDYQQAFFALPVSFVLSILIIFFIRETYCRSAEFLV